MTMLLETVAHSVKIENYLGFRNNFIFHLFYVNWPHINLCSFKSLLSRSWVSNPRAASLYYAATFVNYVCSIKITQ
jgi:hypothetical protein